MTDGWMDGSQKVERGMPNLRWDLNANDNYSERERSTVRKAFMEDEELRHVGIGVGAVERTGMRLADVFGGIGIVWRWESLLQSVFGIHMWSAYRFVVRREWGASRMRMAVFLVE